MTRPRWDMRFYERTLGFGEGHGMNGDGYGRIDNPNPMEEMLAPADPQGLPVGYDDVVVIFQKRDS